MKAEELKEEDINEHSIVTEFIPKEFIPKGKEYVVDFVATKEEIEIYPRETFYLKNGADTYIRLLEYCSEEYMDILHCCKEIVTSLKYEGRNDSTHVFLRWIKIYRDGMPRFWSLFCKL